MVALAAFGIAEIGHQAVGFFGRRFVISDHDPNSQESNRQSKPPRNMVGVTKNTPQKRSPII